jgi:nucleoside-triphosphatase
LLLNILITGSPGVGKTTLMEMIQKKVEVQGYNIGGIYCPEIREKNRRTGFGIVDIATGHEGLLAGINSSGPTVGKYHVNLDDLEEVGVPALKNALGMADYIFIDEIAPMELMSTSFSHAIWEALESQKPVIAAIHLRSSHPFILKVKNRDDVLIFNLSTQNMESVRESILELLLDNEEIK